MNSTKKSLSLLFFLYLFFTISGCFKDSGKTKVEITFKDIPLGAPGSKKALSQLCRQDMSNFENYADRCDFVKVGSSHIWVSYGVLGDVLARLDISSDETLHDVQITAQKAAILGMVEVYTEKYGPPKKYTEVTENKLGTKFDKEIYIWVDPKGTRLTVDSIYEKIDEGRIHIESEMEVNSREVGEKNRIDAAKSNI